MAVEHIVFQLLRHLERQSPGLIDQIEGSLDHLGDPAKDGTSDDAAVVEIARKLLAGALGSPTRHWTSQNGLQTGGCPLWVESGPSTNPRDVAHLSAGSGLALAVEVDAGAGLRHQFGPPVGVEADEVLHGRAASA